MASGRRAHTHAPSRDRTLFPSPEARLLPARPDATPAHALDDGAALALHHVQDGPQVPDVPLRHVLGAAGARSAGCCSQDAGPHPPARPEGQGALSPLSPGLQRDPRGPRSQPSAPNLPTAEPHPPLPGTRPGLLIPVDVHSHPAPGHRPGLSLDSPLSCAWAAGSGDRGLVRIIYVPQGQRQGKRTLRGAGASPSGAFPRSRQRRLSEPSKRGWRPRLPCHESSQNPFSSPFSPRRTRKPAETRGHVRAPSRPISPRPHS